MAAGTNTKPPKLHAREGYMTRRRAAVMILLKMLDSPGPEDGKVEAAVRYTDKLFAALDRAKGRVVPAQVRRLDR